MINNVISESLNTKQSNAANYLAGSGIVLFISVLTMTDAQARDMYRVKPVEIVVYEGNPVDYSSHKNVIVLEETSFQNDYSNQIVVQDLTDDSSSRFVGVAKTNAVKHKHKTRQPSIAQTKPQPLKKVRIAQKPINNKPVAKKAKVQAIAQIARTQINTQPRKTPVQANLLASNIQKIASTKRAKSNLLKKALLPKVKDKNADLIAFYADVFGSSKRTQSQKTTSKISLAVKQNTNKQVIKKKAKLNRVELAKLLPRNKTTKLVATRKKLNKKAINKVEEKDAELVAFYRGVFGTPTSKITKKSTLSKKRVVKQKIAKNIIKKKTKTSIKSGFKPNKRQLAKAITKGKDPELVAFYQQVFGSENNNSSKQILAVSNSKGKDPELVAFYQREFSKGMNNSKKRVISEKGDKKTKLATHSKSKKNKVAKKMKSKTKQSVSTAAVELQKLIDELTSKNII